MKGTKNGAVIGLDLGGSAVGWCTRETQYDGGVFDLSDRKYLHDKMMGFDDFLDDLLTPLFVANINVDLIAYEDPNFNRGRSWIPMLIGLLGLRCGRLGLPYQPVSVPQIKQLATGNGRADKAMMVTAAKERWGYDMTHDEADARWIRQWAIENAEY